MFPVPVERCEDGYKPKYQYRVEDCYMWRDDNAPRAYRWRLRVNKRFTAHPTLRAARVEASRQMGIRE